jgi:HSP90 family molecular chaperone
MTKQDWINAFDELDKEHTELYQEVLKQNLRNLLYDIAKDCNNKEQLERMADFCSYMVGKKVKPCSGGYKLVALDK